MAAIWTLKERVGGYVGSTGQRDILTYLDQRMNACDLVRLIRAPRAVLEMTAGNHDGPVLPDGLYLSLSTL
jgi:hypothetical protein